MRKTLITPPLACEDEVFEGYLYGGLLGGGTLPGGQDIHCREVDVGRVEEDDAACDEFEGGTGFACGFVGVRPCRHVVARDLDKTVLMEIGQAGFCQRPKGLDAVPGGLILPVDTADDFHAEDGHCGVALGGAGEGVIAKATGDNVDGTATDLVGWGGHGVAPFVGGLVGVGRMRLDWDWK
jgi:hypothetical protein